MNAYRKLCTEFYDLDKPAAPTEALERYVHHAQEAAGPILEPMCGSGRFLVPLRLRGFDIDGIDASPQMLEACRQKLARLGLHATLLQQRMEAVQLDRRYALVIIPAGSFTLITDPHDVAEALRRMYDAMLPAAKLVLELELAAPQPSSSWPWGGRWIQRSDGALIVISWLGYHEATTRITHSIHRYELIHDGRLLETEFEELDTRAYDDREIRELLTSSGFAEVTVHQLEGANAVIECARP